jgi:hypothetical protein
MSKYSQQIKLISQNPKAYMNYLTQGKLPHLVKPSSPLITLLESLTPRMRQEIRGVRLHPELGYNTNIQFNTAEQLLRYLKPNEYIKPETSPAEQYRIKHFNKPLRVKELLAHSTKHP